MDTDVSRPAALPTANLQLRQTTSQHPALQNPELSSAEYLDAVEEEWNKKVDAEVETLVDGMVDLVNLASISNKDKFIVAQESFQAQSRAESMVRALSSLSIKGSPYAGPSGVLPPLRRTFPQAPPPPF